MLPILQPDRSAASSLALLGTKFQLAQAIHVYRSDCKRVRQAGRVTLAFTVATGVLTAATVTTGVTTPALLSDEGRRCLNAGLS